MTPQDCPRDGRPTFLPHLAVLLPNGWPQLPSRTQFKAPPSLSEYAIVEDKSMPWSNEVENTGSQARDFCMLERNLLSHLKLALLLALLSWSVLLQARLVPPTEPSTHKNSGGIPLSVVEYAAALFCIAAGCWEYYNGYWDLRRSTPFLRAVKLHAISMAAIVAVVFGTCVALLIED